MKAIKISLAVMALIVADPAPAFPGSMALLGVGGSAPVTGGYTGPLDVAPGAIECWSLRACSAAKAAAGAMSIDLASASSPTAAQQCVAVKVKSTGDLDTNVGLYCNSASQTVSAWCSASSICTTANTTARIVTKYGQVGGVNLTAASYAVAEPFILSGPNSHPIGQCIGTNATYISGTFASIVPQPFTLAAVFQHNGTTTGFDSYTTGDNGTSAEIVGGGTANTVIANTDAGSISGTALDGTAGTFAHFHSAVFSSPLSGATNASTLAVDGTANPGTISNFAQLGTAPGECAGPSNGNPATAYIAETIWWGSVISSPTALNANQTAYW